MTGKLLPCPFCGVGFVSHCSSGDAAHRVMCHGCKSSTGFCSSSGEAIEVWNRRRDPVKDELVAALEKAENILLNTPWGCARAEDLTECHTVINKALAKAKGGAQ